MPPSFNLAKPTAKSSLLGRILSPVLSIFSRALQIFLPNFNWWKPLRLSRWLHHNHGLSTFYVQLNPIHVPLSASIYRFLRFLPSGHSVPLYPSAPTLPPSSPYRIFFNVYKPSTPFKKTAPPLPDFQIIVVKYVLHSCFIFFQA